MDAHTERFTSRIIDWYEVAGRDLPWRAEDFTPWGILVSEFMLQQTQVDRVIPKLTAWLERWPTPKALAGDSPAEAVRMWDRLGYPRRALWLHQAAVEITERHGGVVPNDVDTLLGLKGVGPYTARAIAAFAYAVREPVVDTNTRRVIARAIDGVASAGMPNERIDLPAMARLLPLDEAKAQAFNAGIMELGATVCVARSPKCESCPVARQCAWRAAGYPDNAPAKRPRQAKFEGSDRQVRGIVLGALRNAPGPLAESAVGGFWDDPAQLGRALDSLLRDELIELTPRGFVLVGD
ncbi:MAG TPA: A/G-specific adenine glycosylase [Microbacteriaceae bacterium]|nr:A/G-specific adenine glycosylase [Microbacteriaceae bacterium]